MNHPMTEDEIKAYHDARRAEAGPVWFETPLLRYAVYDGAADVQVLQQLWAERTWDPLKREWNSTGHGEWRDVPCVSWVGNKTVAE